MKPALAILLLTVAPVALFPASAAEFSTNALAPGVALTVKDYDSLRAAARNNLAAFLRQITPLNYQSMGFSSTNEVSSATNGPPVLTFTVTMSQLTNYIKGNDYNSLLNPPPEPIALVPVMVGTNVRSSTSLRLAKGTASAQWVNGDWGRPRLIRNLMSALATIPSNEVSQGSIPFAVEIPVPRIWFVGYYDKQKSLVLVTPTDLRLRNVRVGRHERISAAGIEEIAKAARGYNPDFSN